jgi:hypothetical protein
VIIGYRGQGSQGCSSGKDQAGSARTAGVWSTPCGPADRGRDGSDLPPLLRSILPAAWDETGLVAAPYLAPNEGPVGAAAVRLTFRPPNPLTDGGHAVV